MSALEKKSIAVIRKHKPELALVIDSPKLKVLINSIAIAITLLDTKAKINIITRELISKVKLAICYNKDLIIILYNKAATYFERCYKNVKLEIGKLRIL